MTKENIGFVGLGRMGMRMALRLVDSFSVFVQTRTRRSRTLQKQTGSPGPMIPGRWQLYVVIFSSWPAPRVT